MCPESNIIPEIPVETAQAVRSLYNIQHVYLRIGDELGNVQSQVNIPQLDTTSSLSPDAVLRLALVTAFQYAEDLPDQAAAVASMRRMDWKYALHLPVKHPGFNPATLCVFRQNLFPSQNGLNEFSVLLDLLNKMGLFAWATSSAPLEAAETLSIVCMVTRLSNLKLKMKSALSTLVSTAPEWMRANALPYWYHRYSTGALAHPARTNAKDLIEEANIIGLDIHRLLTKVPGAGPLDPSSREIIESLSRSWKNEFTRSGNTIHWKMPDCSTCSTRSASEINL